MTKKKIMTLEDYLYYTEETQVVLASKLNICIRYMNGLVRGYYVPSRKLAKHIEIVTNGKVKAQDLLFPRSKEV